MFSTPLSISLSGTLRIKQIKRSFEFGPKCGGMAQQELKRLLTLRSSDVKQRDKKKRKSAYQDRTFTVSALLQEVSLAGLQKIANKEASRATNRDIHEKCKMRSYVEQNQKNFVKGSDTSSSSRLRITFSVKTFQMYKFEASNFS